MNLEIVKTLIGRFVQSPIVHRIARGGAWMALSTVVMSILGIATTICVARILGKEGFGRYGLVQSSVITFAGVAAGSMAVTSTKFLAQYRGSDPERAGRLAGLCWIVSALVGFSVTLAIYFGANWLAVVVGEEELSQLFRIVAPSVFYATIIGAQKGMLAGFEQFRVLAIINIIIAVANLPLLVGGTWFFHVEGTILGYVLINLVNLGINSYFLRRTFTKEAFPFTFRGIFQEKDILWRFSFPHAMSSLLNTPVTWLSSVFLARQPGGIEQLGIFSAATRWRQVMLFLPATLSQPSVPVLAERLSSGDYRAVTRILFGTLGVIVPVCGGLTLLLMILSKPIMATFGSDFIQDGVPTLLVLLSAAFVQAVITPFSNLTTSAGRTWASFAGVILKSTILIFTAILMVGRGAPGLAVAHFLSLAASLAFLVSVTIWIISRRKAQ